MDYSELEIHALREQRRRLQCEEDEISYLRRMLQGRIDILKNELATRSDGQTDLIARLPEILADAPSDKSTGTRYVAISTDSMQLGESTTGTQPQVDSIRQNAVWELADTNKSDPSKLTDQELNEAIAALMAHEQLISKERTALHIELDAVASEITQRYLTGDASVEDLLVDAKRHKDVS